MTKTGSDTLVYDLVIIGGGASGLICATTALNNGKSVLIIEHGKQFGRKLLISGGGRCNFTNYNLEAFNYLCRNSHFVKSALAQFSQWDMIALVEQAQIAYQQRLHGQLFCEHRAKDLLNMLLANCSRAQFYKETSVTQVTKMPQGFELKIDTAIAQQPQVLHCQKLVIATGGLSYPKLGATPFGYRIAEQFGHQIISTRAGLVPFTLHEQDKQKYATLSGIALPVEVTCEFDENSSEITDKRDMKKGQKKISFKEQLLFTHRGLSGPALLQISNYWQAGSTLKINLIPQCSVLDYLIEMKQRSPNKSLKNSLASLPLDRNQVISPLEIDNNQQEIYFIPKRVLDCFLDATGLQDRQLKQLNLKEMQEVSERFHAWHIAPNNTEGYRTAEVTLGGVSTDEIDSKSMQSKRCEGLYFVGEVLDVTGWLGGYNLQWAWSSGVVAGRSI